MSSACGSKHSPSSTASSSSRSQHRRPRSPVSMYVPVEYGVPKPPRPLIKIDKEPKKRLKESPSLSSCSSSFPSSPPPTRTHAKSRSSLSIVPLLQRVSLRRKSVANVAVAASPASERAPTISSPLPGQGLPTPPPDTPTFSPLQQRLRQLDKIKRTLGEGVPDELILGELQRPPQPEFPFAGSPTRGGRPSTANSSRSRANDQLWLKRRPSLPSKVKRRVSVSWLSPSQSEADGNVPPGTHDAAPDHDVSSSTDNEGLSMAEIFALDPPSYRNDYSPISIEIPSHSRDDSTSDTESPVFTPPHFDESEGPSPISFGPPSANDLSRKTSAMDLVVTEPVVTISSPPASRRTHAHTPKSSVTDACLLHPPRPETPFMHNLNSTDSDAFVEIHDSTTSISRATRKERRQGWSGEWNRDNMQDVIAKLRSLR